MDLTGYTPIALRNNHLGNCVVSYNESTGDFIIAVNGKLSAGPFTKAELESLRDNLSDVIEMKSLYMFIKDFDVLGNEV